MNSAYVEAVGEFRHKLGKWHFGSARCAAGLVFDILDITRINPDLRRKNYNVKYYTTVVLNSECCWQVRPVSIFKGWKRLILCCTQPGIRDRVFAVPRPICNGQRQSRTKGQRPDSNAKIDQMSCKEQSECILKLPTSPSNK